MNIFSIVFAFLAFSGIIIVMQALTAKPRQDLIAERLAQYRDHNLRLDGVMGVTSLPLKGGALGLGFVLGRFLPDVWLNNKIKGRQKELRLALPNALDLLTISVEAGLGFDAAIGRLTEKFKNALSDEFAQVLNEIRLGRPGLEAL